MEELRLWGLGGNGEGERGVRDLDSGAITGGGEVTIFHYEYAICRVCVQSVSQFFLLFVTYF